MKNRIFAVVLSLLLVFGLCCVSNAADLEYVTDAAGVLTEEQWSELNTYAQNATEKYGIGLYIVAVDNWYDYTDTASDFDTFTMDTYEDYGFGVGAEHNGMILTVSVSTRDYAIYAYGSSAHEAFTDYGKEYIENYFLPSLSADDWNTAFSTYLEYSDYCLYMWSLGSPIDVPSSGGAYESGFHFTFASLFWGLIIGVLVALVVCLIMKGKLKSVAIATSATNYITANGVAITGAQEVFNHRDVSVRRIERDDDNRGGHGGTTVNDRGFSGHSGKF